MPKGNDLDLLKSEFEFYLANQDDMVAKYDGRVVAIKNHEVLGVYDSYLEALKCTDRGARTRHVLSPEGERR